VQLTAHGPAAEELADDGAGVADVHDDREAELRGEIDLLDEGALLLGARRAAAGEVDADLADRDDAAVGRERAKCGQSSVVEGGRAMRMDADGDADLGMRAGDRDGRFARGDVFAAGQDPGDPRRPSAREDRSEVAGEPRIGEVRVRV